MAIIVEKYAIHDKRSFRLFLKQFFNAILDDGIPFYDVLKRLYNHLEKDCQIYYQEFVKKQRKLAYICYEMAKIFSQSKDEKAAKKELEKIAEILNEFIRIAKKREKRGCCFSFLSANNGNKNIEIDQNSVLFITLPSTNLSSSNSKKTCVLNAELPSKNNQLKITEHKIVGPKPPKRAIQNYSILKQRCLEKGKLFEDPEFPAEDRSLYYCRAPTKQKIKWLRPKEIVKPEKPLFVSNGFSRFDVVQGSLGDCWLLAALANLTLQKEIFHKVVDRKQSFTKDYAGIFHFKFWQYGKWVDVVIDDRLPTCDGELIYMKSSEDNEFWSALLEKAYAKLFGSYEALNGGWACEAVEDFTGGLTEIINLKNAPYNLLKVLFRAIQMGSHFGCSINAETSELEYKLPNGLIKGHAYSVTDMKIVNGPNGPTALIRIRNPWGNDKEWNGAWSDGSKEWQFVPEDIKKKMEVVKKKDGEFWMSFDDFRTNFENLEICHADPTVMEECHSGSHNSWSVKTFHGAWCSGKTAGGPPKKSLKTFSKNPQYLIKLMGDANDEEHTLIIGILQKYRRELKHEDVETLSIKFAIYKLENNDDKKMDKNFFEKTKPVFESDLIYYRSFREVSSRIHLLPGQYLIVPFTDKPEEEANFMLRIFSDGITES
uniref:Calpain catalytic domain-containing protein n=1 Tax=Panagrolaimus sp. PS1159 TaxID=55785 RepID=A0AC35FKW8_9BILA